MLNGLDLFTGIGGITLSLKEWVRPIAYCEIEPYCQSILLQRMQEGYLPKAPIWNDITTFRDAIFDSGLIYMPIDIIYGGFPCQDISIAGAGKGLEGERSGLFFEIMRLAKEIKPKFIFLENVPAITTRGGLQVVSEITSLGYDCRWCMLSAAETGARHKRERWFLLAYSPSESTIRHTQRKKKTYTLFRNTSQNDSNADFQSSKQADKQAVPICRNGESRRDNATKYWPFESRTHWQEIVDTMDKCVDGIPTKLDGIDINEGFMLVFEYANANNTNPRQVLLEMWQEINKATLEEWKTRIPTNISKEEILQQFMCLLLQKCECTPNKEKLLSQTSTKIQENSMRSVRDNRKPSSTSHRPKLEKQRSKQSSNSLQDLPQLLAQNFHKTWKDYCRKNAQNHVKQLKALGNAVVPIQVRQAFIELMGL